MKTQRKQIFLGDLIVCDSMITLNEGGEEEDQSPPEKKVVQLKQAIKFLHKE